MVGRREKMAQLNELLKAEQAGSSEVQLVAMGGFPELDLDTLNPCDGAARVDVVDPRRG